jgi:hypothetical protein
VKYLFNLACILVCFSAIAQKPLAKAKYEGVYIEAGFVQPLGRLASRFEMSPSFGFWIRTTESGKNFVDLGFTLFIPRNASDINFRFKDSTVSYKSQKFAISVGGRYAKVFRLSSDPEGFSGEYNAGAGLAINMYLAPDELEFEKGERSEEILTTFYLSPGFKINYRNTGLQLHYQWAPYGVTSQKIRANYGSHLLMFGIVYRQ